MIRFEIKSKKYFANSSISGTDFSQYLLEVDLTKSSF